MGEMPRIDCCLIFTVRDRIKTAVSLGVTSASISKTKIRSTSLLRYSQLQTKAEPQFLSQQQQGRMTVWPTTGATKFQEQQVRKKGDDGVGCRATSVMEKGATATATTLRPMSSLWIRTDDYRNNWRKQPQQQQQHDIFSRTRQRQRQRQQRRRSASPETLVIGIGLCTIIIWMVTYSVTFIHRENFGRGSTKLSTLNNHRPSSHQQHHRRQVEGRRERFVSLVVSFWAQEENRSRGTGTTSETRPLSSSLSHRDEVYAAMVTNLYNRHINQVVVVLDSSTKANNCTHFVKHMATIRRRRRGSNHGLDGMDQQERHEEDAEEIVSNKLVCIDRSKSQPNYLEMLQYTTEINITDRSAGDFVDDENNDNHVILLSNADQVFDDTLSKVQDIKFDDVGIVVLATAGFPINATTTTTTTKNDVGSATAVVPSNIQESYRKYLNAGDNSADGEYFWTSLLLSSSTSVLEMRAKSLCSPAFKGALHSSSWDTYIYKQSTMMKALSTVDDFMGKPLFRRRTEAGVVAATAAAAAKKKKKKKSLLSQQQQQEDGMEYYFMNEVGAENAALFDILQAMTKYDTDTGFRNNRSNSHRKGNRSGMERAVTKAGVLKVWNVCAYIRSWHFHLSPKTHYGETDGTTSEQGVNIQETVIRTTQSRTMMQLPPPSSSSPPSTRWKLTKGQQAIVPTRHGSEGWGISQFVQICSKRVGDRNYCYDEVFSPHPATSSTSKDK